MTRWRCLLLLLLLLIGKSFAFSVTTHHHESLIVESEQSTEMVRCRARVAYHGLGFEGFQFQPNKRTVQSFLEQVLEERFGRLVRVVAAGRTDAGVHARGQAIHFDLYPHEWSSLRPDTLQKMIGNKRNVSLWDLQRANNPITFSDTNGKQVRAPWSAMYQTTGKLYVYRIAVGCVMDPMLRHDRWQVALSPPVNVSRLRSVVEHFQGTHDFRAFATGVDRMERKGGFAETVRTVYRATLVTEDAARGLYRMEFHLDGALYKMVRNLAGTAVAVSCGHLGMDTFERLLLRESSRCDNPCKPAPPHGLTLEWVYYDDF